MNINKKLSSKGFTLIDILLTSAIVSLLSSLFLFQISEARKKADDSHMKVEAQQVSNAVALYKNDHEGRVPLSVTGAPSVRYTETQSEYQATMQLLVDGGYIAEIPTSPSGTSYTYSVSQDKSEAVFGVRLNKAVANNKKNSCSATPSQTFNFTSCSTSGICSPGQISETSSCFLLSSAAENCHCTTTLVYSLNPNTYPSQVCSEAYAVGDCPIISYKDGQEDTMYTQKSNFDNGIDKRNLLALPYITSLPTGYMTCQHDPVPMGSDTIACDGSSESEYCECI